MLTSFFSKTKPVNTIVVLVYMTIGFLVTHFVALKDGYVGTDVLRIVGLWILYVFTMFVLNFVSQKNELTKRTSYRILLFAAFTLSFPAALLSPKILISGVFVMLAMRRILSLRSGLHMERKLFDAGLWLALGTLTFFLSHLFIIVLLGALVFYGRASIRYWFIPILAFVVVAVLTTCYVLYMGEGPSFILDIIEEVSFDFGTYSNLDLLIPIAFVCALLLWTIWSFLKELSINVIAQRPLYLLVLLFAFVSLGLVLVATEKSGKEWYFFTIPMAIIATSFFENPSSKWIPEILLWLIVLLPFIQYVI